MIKTTQHNFVLFLIVALSFLGLAALADLEGIGSYVLGLALGQWALVLSWLGYTGRLSMLRVVLIVISLVVLSSATSHESSGNTISDQLVLFLLSGVGVLSGCQVLIHHRLRRTVCRSSSITSFGVPEVLALTTLVACLLGLTYQTKVVISLAQIAQSMPFVLAIWLAMCTLTRDRLWKPATVVTMFLFAGSALIPPMQGWLPVTSLLMYLATVGCILRTIGPGASKKTLPAQILEATS